MDKVSASQPGNRGFEPHTDQDILEWSSKEELHCISFNYKDLGY